AGRRQVKPRSRWRGPILFTLILLLALGTAIGAWWYGAGRYTVTPSLLELTVAEAQQQAAAEGLTAVTGEEQFSEVVEAGLVVTTEPGPGERILKDGTVELVISRGPERYEIPVLVGETREDAEQAVDDANLTLGGVEEQFHDEVAEGVVISQSVEAGEQVRPGTEVSFVVSKGRQPIEIQDFTGRSVAEAQQVLGDAGFTVVPEPESNPTVPAGVVISQDPASGTGFRGDEIRLKVSQGPQNAQVPVPNVVGWHIDQARPFLELFGFEVESRGGFLGGRIVQNQNPKAGEFRDFGSTVRLQLGR
ncbi:MAG: PASTA domain-containing protein, partial [Jiangellaceae bacterium]